MNGSKRMDKTKFFWRCFAFRSVCVAVCFFAGVGVGIERSAGQETGTATANDSETHSAGAATEAANGTWRDAAPSSAVESTPVAAPSSSPLDETNVASFTGTKTTKFSLEFDKEPSDAGQFWVVYDLTPYSERFPNVENPQLSIVDWIAFDAGDDFWRKEPFSAFSASPKKLYVYHNANVQRYVANVVDRFIDTEKRNKSFSVKVVAVQSPEWRVRVASYLTPAPVKVVGAGADVQGWIVERSNFAKVVAEIEKRSDYTLLNSVKNVVPNGEKNGWAAQSPKRQYVRDVRVDASAVAGYVEDFGAIDEGFRIETTPLLSTNGEALEMLFRYRSTVVEKMKTFNVSVPTSTSPRQRLEVEKPSIVSCDFRGKISFLKSKAAIVDLGMVPMTLPNKSESNGVIGNISKFIAPQSAFYDVLILIEDAN